MDIQDINGGAPDQALAVYSRAAYRAVGVPQVPGTLRWTLGGDTSPLRVEAGDAPDRVVVVSLHRSEQAGASTLTATFTPADSSPATSASIPLTVWAAQIEDAGGAALPTRTLGVGNLAHYRGVVQPPLQGVVVQATWQPAGQPGIAIARVGGQGLVDVLGQAATPDNADALLQLTLTLGGQQAKASQALTVFDLAIDWLAEGPDGLVPTGPFVGVGETRVGSARVRPESVLQVQPPPTWAWSAPEGLQPLGDTNAPNASFVATTAGADTPVRVALTLAASTVQAERRVTVFGVRIVGADEGTPSPSLPVGGQLALRAVIEPALPEARCIWSASGAISVLGADDQAVATGAQPSDSEGADAIALNVLMEGALAHALAPVTVYRAAITAPGGGTPTTQLPSSARQRYAVATEPALSSVAVSWAVQQGNAALAGATTQPQVELVTLGPSDRAGDIVLGVSVVPVDMPHGAPNATLAITAGSQRG